MNKPTSEFFTKVMGEVQGPFTAAQIRALAKNGRLLPDSHVRKGANGNWTTADGIKGLSFAQTAFANASRVATSPPTHPKPAIRKPGLLVPVLVGAISVLVVAVSVLAYLLLSRGSSPNELSPTLASSATATIPESNVVVAPVTPPANSSDKNRLPHASPPAKQSPAESIDEPSRDVRCREWLKAHYEVSNYVVTLIGDTEVILGYNNSLVYVPERDLEVTSSISDGLDFKLGYRTASDQAFQDAIGNHIKIDGKAVHVPFQSSNASVAKVYDDGSCGLSGKGTCKVGVQLPNQRQLVVPVETKSIPVNLSLSFLDSSSAADVVRILGLPDKREEYSESWPDAVHENGMTHVTSPGGVASVEHWKYDKYPGLVLAFRNGEHLEEIGTYFDPN